MKTWGLLKYDGEESVDAVPGNGAPNINLTRGKLHGNLSRVRFFRTEMLPKDNLT
jgi:hypothetical protein